MAGPGVLVIPPLVEGIKCLGLAIGGLVLGQAAVQTAEEVRRNARTTNLPMADTCVGNCGPPPDPCKTGPFDQLECEPGEHRHPIISDYIIRAGRRAETGMRLPGPPPLGQGPSICVSDGTHRSIHRRMDQEVAQLGPGATIEDVKRIAMVVIAEVKPERASKMGNIRRQLDDAFRDMDQAGPVRTTPRLPGTQDRARLLGNNNVLGR